MVSGRGSDGAGYPVGLLDDGTQVGLGYVGSDCGDGACLALLLWMAGCGAITAPSYVYLVLMYT